MIAKLLLSLILLSFSSFSFAAKITGWQTINTSDTMQCSNLSTFISDSSGNLYQAGYAGFDDNGFIRKSTDKGYTWNNLFNFPKYDLTAFAIDQQGAFYVAGSQDPNYWQIQKSTDGGQTWNTVDVGPQFSSVTTLAVAPNGDIYAGGPGRPGDGDSIIRKSVDNGKTWTTVDDFYWGSNKAKGNKTKFNKTKSNNSKANHTDDSGEINAIFFDASGDVYYIVENLWCDTWYVRMSTDQGATWTTIDRYFLGNWALIGSAAVIDSAGNIYVAGLWTDEDKSNIGHWIIRKGSKTKPFVTVDDFKYPDNKRITAPDKIVIDKNGKLYVSGEVIDEESSPKTRALIRMSTDAGAHWSTWDDFPANPGDRFFSANHILIDNQGNFYAGLVYTDADYNDRWLTRKYFP